MAGNSAAYRATRTNERGGIHSVIPPYVLSDAPTEAILAEHARLTHDDILAAQAFASDSDYLAQAGHLRTE
jgi:hypothetical protein